MDFENIHQSLNSISAITPQAWSDFKILLKPLEIKKGAYLIKSGVRVHNCYILQKGLIRVYYSNDSNEYNKTFFTPNTFPTPISALISKEPCALSFQALLDAELVQFSYEGFKALFKKHQCLESLMLRILEIQWIKKEKHDIEMVTNDATTNYLIFRKQFPTLENQITQYHIASYLGITPIQLSRIRAQLSKST